jgi:hypothetical protein
MAKEHYSILVVLIFRGRGANPSHNPNEVQKSKIASESRDRRS